MNPTKMTRIRHYSPVLFAAVTALLLTGLLYARIQSMLRLLQSSVSLENQLYLFSLTVFCLLFCLFAQAIQFVKRHGVGKCLGTLFGVAAVECFVNNALSGCGLESLPSTLAASLLSLFETYGPVTDRSSLQYDMLGFCYALAVLVLVCYLGGFAWSVWKERGK